MTRKRIQAILSQVEKPSSYVGTEINRILKDPRSVRLRMALAFPDLYEIGTSHFGLQILYHLLNGRDDIAVERVFAPGPDLEAQLREHGLPLFSLESHTPLAEFDIIGFSLLYELSYSNVLCMLDLAGVPLLASQRENGHPIVIAGGPCTCNPEPMADFFDAMVVGDGEEVLPAMADRWMAWRAKGHPREFLLRSWADIPGVYIPCLFIAQETKGPLQAVQAICPEHDHVVRAVISQLDRAYFPTRPVVPFGRPVHDRLRIEIARGCSRGCRFCQAGMIYRPVRERSPDGLMDLAQRALGCTGYDELSLLSLSSGDYSAIQCLMDGLTSRFSGEHLALSLPSLRAGSLTPDLMQAIRKVRKTGFTIAPEAGSQRLRNVINKNIDNQQIRQTVSEAFAQGWNLIKLYFMVGLPTEQRSDLEELVRLVRELRHMVRSGPRGGRAQINISVGTFIPKPHTPFQWCAQLSVEESMRRINWLRDHLRFTGIQFKWQKPEASYLEGLFARGDRRLSELLRIAFRRGARFDGWTDFFNWGLWRESIAEAGVESAYYVERERPVNEPLPWDHVRSGVSPEFLKQEYKKALAGILTEDCRAGNCQGCGLCNFQSIAPRLAEPGVLQADSVKTMGPDPGSDYCSYVLVFNKTGPARFFGHLELISIFMRAFRRAGIRVRYSQGFHPKPRLSFEDALPIGMESLCEVLHLQILGLMRVEEVMNALNAQLPEGLTVVSGQGGDLPKACDTTVRYRMQLTGESFDPLMMDVFRSKETFMVDRNDRRGQVQSFDLKMVVVEIDLIKADELSLALKTIEGKKLRPSEIVSAIFGLSAGMLRQARTTKLASEPLC